MDTDLDRTVREIVDSKEFSEFVTMEICQHYVPGWRNSPYVQRSRRIRTEDGLRLELSDRLRGIVAGHAFSKAQWHEILYGFWLGLDDLVALYAKEDISPSRMSRIRDLHDFYEATLNEVESCFIKSGQFSYKKYRAVFHLAYDWLHEKKIG